MVRKVINSAWFVVVPYASAWGGHQWLMMIVINAKLVGWLQGMTGYHIKKSNALWQINLVAWNIDHRNSWFYHLKIMFFVFRISTIYIVFYLVKNSGGRNF